MKLKTYSKERKTNPLALKHGEIVDCILLQENYSNAYIKELNVKNEALKKEAESLGEDAVLLQPNRKQGGINWQIAVIRRNITIYEDGTESADIVWKSDDGQLIKPKYIATTSFSQLPPKTHLEARSASGVLYGDLFRRGGDTSCGKAGKPKIIDLLPSVNPVKDFKTGMVATEVPEYLQEKYKSLLQSEITRKAEWEEVLTDYNKCTEDECYDWLSAMVSRRLLLCNREGDTFNYLNPMPGIIFRAQVDNYNGGDYFNIRAIGDWNKSKREFEVFTTGNVRYPGEQETAVTVAILAALVSPTPQEEAVNDEQPAGMDEQF